MKFAEKQQTGKSCPGAVISRPQHPGSENEFPCAERAQDVDELITEAVSEILEEVMDDPEIAAINKNKEIVIRLEEKGIFNIKDAVVKVADQLEISKNTHFISEIR